MILPISKIMKIKERKLADHKKAYRFLRAIDITPQDDAFHGNFNFLDIEWWYFDAVFDNGYSVHVGFRTYHIRNSGIIQARVTIYKDGKTIVEEIKPFLFSNFYTSSERPIVKINDKSVMEFDSNHFKKTGEWKYRITLSIDKQGIDLTFIGTTKGWKIETSKTCWSVALPKANVSGTLTVDGCDIPVKGIGYHDHNWNYSPTTAVSNLGWFWGRITTETLNITWSKTMETKEKGDLISIINLDKKQLNNNTEFYSVHPSDIIFISKEFIMDHNKLIPTEFELKFSDPKSDNKTSIQAKIAMKTYDIHHSRIFTIHYWRYHVKTNGTISIGSTTETLNDKPQIIEFLSFRS